MRMWSVNTWLIVICVAVFLIDGFLPLQTVEMAVHLNPDLTQEPDLSAVVGGPVEVLVWAPLTRGSRPADHPQREWLLGKQQLLTPQGQVVGWRELRKMRSLQSMLHFSTRRGFFEVHFWRFIGFQFLHANFGHLLVNMIVLYFFGGMVERYLGSKRYLAFYLLCGLFGALMYTLLNIGGYVAAEFFGVTKAIPGLLFNDFYKPLIGASAGVFGVLMAGAYLAPKATVLLFFIIPMQLRTLAYGLLAFALIMIITGGKNAGGE
ncbi:MAG: rhomboid family intramembrane serine protease, partial [Planctomycetes bacterium]|nr:rhomboid family intramembrane serine protease [Planctomycetota bacterium]